jgi:hypothetical protein
MTAEERRSERQLGRGAAVGNVEGKASLEGSAPVIVAARRWELESAGGLPGTGCVDAVEPKRASSVIRVAHEVIRIDIREPVAADEAEDDAVSQGEIRRPVVFLAARGGHPRTGSRQKPE